MQQRGAWKHIVEKKLTAMWFESISCPELLFLEAFTLVFCSRLDNTKPFSRRHLIYTQFGMVAGVWSCGSAVNAYPARNEMQPARAGCSREMFVEEIANADSQTESKSGSV